jgi:hypothetical protein
VLLEWELWMDNVESWLVEVDTHPSIVTCDLTALHLQSTDTWFLDMTDNFSAPAAAAQDVIGWQNFMEGKIAKEWGQLQDCHYVHLQSRCTVDHWTSRLILQLLELMHGMWTHRNKTLHVVDDQ